LHMAAFGLFHAVAVLLIHRAFGGRLQGRGQALYSALGFGVGGALGSLGSGYAWTVAGPGGAFTGAALVAALAAGVAWWGLAQSAGMDQDARLGTPRADRGAQTMRNGE
jgi:MFS transporter, PPP family, 3-phenylpropionic acid transporter